MLSSLLAIQISRYSKKKQLSAYDVRKSDRCVKQLQWL